MGRPEHTRLQQLVHHRSTLGTPAGKFRSGLLLPEGLSMYDHNADNAVLLVQVSIMTVGKACCWQMVQHAGTDRKMLGGWELQPVSKLHMLMGILQQNLMQQY